MSWQDIRVEHDAGIATITIDRAESGNKFRRETTLELAEALRQLRDDSSLRVGIITGSGDRFFCIGGEHEETSGYDHSAVLPILDVYELIDTIPKPIIAAVNGFAVGGGNVLHVMCDLSVAAENAVFRQVGPMVGSFDAGYGTWYLEEAIGRKRAKAMWYLNHKYSAETALSMGLVNEVVASGMAVSRSRELAQEMISRGPQALAALKASFSGRHTGVVGQARLAHDLLLTQYLGTEESDELSHSFDERREPDRTRFNK